MIDIEDIVKPNCDGHTDEEIWMLRAMKMVDRYKYSLTEKATEYEKIKEYSKAAKVWTELGCYCKQMDKNKDAKFCAKKAYKCNMKDIAAKCETLPALYRLKMLYSKLFHHKNI